MCILCWYMLQNWKLLLEADVDSACINSLLTQALNQLPEGHPQLELATSLLDLVHVL